jgi:hypothetical protein
MFFTTHPHILCCCLRWSHAHVAGYLLQWMRMQMAAQHQEMPLYMPVQCQQATPQLQCNLEVQELAWQALKQIKQAKAKTLPSPL